LSRASGGGDISLVGLSLDVKRLFKYKGWTFAPFIRPNTFYTLDISKRFSIYAKNPNEHYYQTTEWNNNSDTSLAIRFSPIKLSMGVQCSHRLKGRFFAYSSIQYVSGDIHLGFLKSQQDFYDVKSIEQVDYRQRFRYLGFDFGVYWYFQ
jgi:hypothetical protein